MLGTSHRREQRNKCRLRSVGRKLMVPARGECPGATVDPNTSSFNLAVERSSCFKFMSIWRQESNYG